MNPLKNYILALRKKLVMKGITPIIATVLLLLIPIVIVGLAFVFLSGTSSDVQGATEESVANLATKIDVQFSIESQVGTNFYIRNKGEKPIEAGTLTVYADNEAVDAQILEPIQAGAVGPLSVPPEVIVENEKLRVVGTIYEQTVTIEKGEIVGEWS